MGCQGFNPLSGVAWGLPHSPRVLGTFPTLPISHHAVLGCWLLWSFRSRWCTLPATTSNSWDWRSCESTEHAIRGARPFLHLRGWAVRQALHPHTREHGPFPSTSGSPCRCLECRHPFDSTKWRRVLDFLVDQGRICPSRVVAPREASHQDLLTVSMRRGPPRPETQDHHRNRPFSPQRPRSSTGPIPPRPTAPRAHGGLVQATPGGRGLTCRVLPPCSAGPHSGVPGEPQVQC